MKYQFTGPELCFIMGYKFIIMFDMKHVSPHKYPKHQHKQCMKKLGTFLTLSCRTKIQLD